MAKYIFTKNSSLEKPQNVSEYDFSHAQYGDEFIYEPKDVAKRTYLLSGSEINEDNFNYRQLRSLKNTINYYKAQDDIFNFDNFYGRPCALHSFYTSHLGSGFKPGTVELGLYVSGSLVAKATDSRADGVLYQENNDEKIGIVLYKEGFIIINHTGSLTNQDVRYISNINPPYGNGLFFDKLKWIYAFIPSYKSVYYDLKYGVKNYVATNINFVHAEKNQLNHSNNPTYLQSGSYSVQTSSFYFQEDAKMEVKKTIKPSFVSGSSENDKQTFITHIGLYNKEKKLIGVGSLANPVRKTENREYTFKLKIDI